MPHQDKIMATQLHQVIFTITKPQIKIVIIDIIITLLLIHLLIILMIMILQDKCHLWLLDDARIGNLNQLRAIANYLQPYFIIKEKKITFTVWSKLPNYLNLIHNFAVKIAPLSKAAIQPQFILSAGRKSALAAIHIKRLYPQCKIIQIMRPNLPAKLFDFIITPKHDNYINANFETRFTPNLITPQTLTNIASHSSQIIKQQKNILFVIGGKTKQSNISKDNISLLCRKLINLHNKHNCKIMLTTSRRTGIIIEEIIKDYLQDYAELYLWSKQKSTDNPYLNMLAKCNYIVCSADSISMISEALSSGKTTYVIEENFGDKKHHKFIAYLKKDQLIRSANLLFTKGPDKQNNNITNEAQNCANAIIEQFSLYHVFSFLLRF
jgi:mitochondrial fission protein ELM1